MADGPRTAAAAFAWEFRRRTRTGLLALGAYLLAIGIVRGIVLGPLPPSHPGGLFALTVSVPLTAAFFWLVAVFCHGLAGDLGGRASLFPARMLALPVTTAQLAGCPMAYGAASIAAFYLVGNLAAVRPSGVVLPWIWPAVYLAAFLAWMQVLAWMPWGLRGLRVVLAVGMLVTLDAAGFVAVELEVPEPLMLAVLVPLLLLAFVAGRAAVARARRGEVPDWGRAWARTTGREPGGARWSAGRAQAWLEWRQHGASLPAWVAIVLPFQLAALHLVRDEPRTLTVLTLGAMLLSPPFVAAFAPGPPMTAFVATRPVTSAALLRAKLRTAAASTALAWVLVLVALPIGITAARAWPYVHDRAARFVVFTGLPRACAFAALVVAWLAGWTWKQLVQATCIGLTGSERVVKGSMLLRLGSLVLLGPVLHLLAVDDDARALLWDGVPWLLGAFVAAKLGAAAWIARRIAIGDRALLLGVGGWLAAAVLVFSVLGWWLSVPHAPAYVLLLLATSAVPLVRPSAALLVLDRSRHGGVVPLARRTPAPVLLALPLVAAAALAASFHLRNRNNGTLVSSGVEREYLLYVPPTYDPARPVPLVISLHGAAMRAAAQRDVSRWNDVADEHGFLVVYPSGWSHGGPRVWRMGSGEEVRFIADLIDHLQARYAIDPRRIYADGLSNGGGMAFVLSCRLPDRIAAAGLVGSAQLLPWSSCGDAPPVPMIAFHGTEDRYAPYHGGGSPVIVDDTRLPDIPDWAAQWARRNGCGPAPHESRVTSDVTRREYVGCASDATVALYTVEGGGHTWPGGGPLPEWFVGRTTRSVHASREEWAFFNAHPLPDMLRRPAKGATP